MAGPPGCRPRFGGLATKIDEKHLDVGRRLDVIEREPAALRDALRDVDRRCDEISQVLGKLADEQRRLTEQLPRPPRR